jgi:hypothetical protein
MLDDSEATGADKLYTPYKRFPSCPKERSVQNEKMARASQVHALQKRDLINIPEKLMRFTAFANKRKCNKGNGVLASSQNNSSS